MGKRIQSAQTRMGQFPKHLMRVCRNEATWYAKCMAGKNALRKEGCEKEFQALKICIRTAAKQRK